MTIKTNAMRTLPLLLMTACAEVDSPSDPQDGQQATPGEAHIAGVLDGQGFVLTHAMMLRGSTLSTFCAADVPLDDHCSPEALPGTAVVLVGRFLFRHGSEPLWAIPQVRIARRSASRVQASLARSGTLSLPEDFLETETAAGTLTLEFGEGSARGIFRVVPQAVRPSDAPPSGQ
jgi:hypothetical protein